MGFAMGFTLGIQMWLDLLWETSQKGDHIMGKTDTSKKNKHLTAEDRKEIDRIISEGLQKGQHIYHIMASSPEITCSKSTVYRHF